MKQFILLISILICLDGLGQDNSTHLRYTFIKAKEGGNYRENLLEKFAKLHKQRIEDGIIEGWDVWEVVNARQTPFSHVVVTLMDISKMDSLYSGVNMQKVFPYMTDSDLAEFYKSNIESRDIIGDYMVTNIKSASKTGIFIDEFMTMNFMMVKEGKFKTYETMEINLVKEGLPQGDLRSGWNLQKRVDKYGTNLDWNYLTLDWYAKYSDFINHVSAPAMDADKDHQAMMAVRDLRESVTLRLIKMVR